MTRSPPKRSSETATAGSITAFVAARARPIYDRTSNFLESMMRQVERKKTDRVLIVTHGLTIRCFIMTPRARRELGGELRSIRERDHGAVLDRKSVV